MTKMVNFLRQNGLREPWIFLTKRWVDKYGIFSLREEKKERSFYFFSEKLAIFWRRMMRLFWSHMRQYQKEKGFWAKMVAWRQCGDCLVQSQISFLRSSGERYRLIPLFLWSNAIMLWKAIKIRTGKVYLLEERFRSSWDTDARGFL